MILHQKRYTLYRVARKHVGVYNINWKYIFGRSAGYFWGRRCPTLRGPPYSNSGYSKSNEAREKIREGNAVAQAEQLLVAWRLQRGAREENVLSCDVTYVHMSDRNRKSLPPTSSRTRVPICFFCASVPSEENKTREIAKEKRRTIAH